MKRVPTLRERELQIEFEVLIEVVMKGYIFWHVPPCSPLKINWRLGKCRLHLQDRRTSQERKQCEAGSKLSLTLKFEATFSSETSVNFPRNTRSYIPENRILHELELFVNRVFAEVDLRAKWIWLRRMLYDEELRNLYMSCDVTGVMILRRTRHAAPIWKTRITSQKVTIYYNFRLL
jgi:hypothetical protein